MFPMLLAAVLIAPSAPVEPVEKLDAATQAKIKKLMTQRRDALKKALAGRKDEFDAGRATMDSLQEISRQLLQAELALATKQAERVAAHADYLKLARETEKLVKARYEAGRTTEVEYHLASAERMDAEANWLKAGGRKRRRTSNAPLEPTCSPCLPHPWPRPSSAVSPPRRC